MRVSHKIEDLLCQVAAEVAEIIEKTETQIDDLKDEVEELNIKLNELRGDKKC